MHSNIWKVMGFGSLDSAAAELIGEIQAFKDLAIENWSLDDCIENSNSFSVLHALFKMIKLIPNLNATAERSFSILRRIKNYLRSTMGQERLNALLLVAANQDITIEPRVVFNKFVDLATRREDFIKFDENL